MGKQYIGYGDVPNTDTVKDCGTFNTVEEAKQAVANAGLELAEVEAQTAIVQTIKPGEYVKRTADAKKVYKRGAYDASTKRYSLTDCEDMNREIFVKRGTVLFVGFTY